MGDKASLLIVEDDSDLLELYSARLSDEYSVRTAGSGREALDRMDDAIDVVFLDRRMPGMSGDEVLAAIREEGYDCRVTMVTAVEPDFDIADMGFDDYVTKPVTEDDLKGCIESLMRRREYGDRLREYYAVASKVATLEEQKAKQELSENEGFQPLTRRLEELKEESDGIVAEATEMDAVRTLFQEI